MSVEAVLLWESGQMTQRDRFILPQAALTTDATLAKLGASLLSESVCDLDPQSWISPVGLPPQSVARHDFRLAISPVPGRYYPRLAFGGLAEGRRDLRPCRLLRCDETCLVLDLNHPLAGHSVRLILQSSHEEAAPGRFRDIFTGPGMQVPPPQAAACYLPEGALSRFDETADSAFYSRPRLVHHLDAACRSALARLYARFLEAGMRVLDLMSSWESHLPTAPADLAVTGLGMNSEELAANPRLHTRVVHDLNSNPRLPFHDASFDLVICTASVEYLTDPATVFAEVRRVLCAGGKFVLTFSDRWFPPKAIRVWSELHPFERLGFLLWLLDQTGFSALHGETLRGLKRPRDDRYSSQRDYSDPLFACWGQA
ncbi:methyltransferase domain-containing protein [Thiobacter aerophilum]|uniref:Methyltransferase domain-containing protein n=1 Tax=Thiobacter aerophilum TaxID=3121275 RepID=A0ABV0EHA6_9BURK